MHTLKERIKQFPWMFEGRQIRLGVGCSPLGQAGQNGEDAKLLRACYAAGFRYFDTSCDYGESELVVGEFLAEIDRQTVFIATKSNFPFQQPDGFDVFVRNFYESFTRLQTDYIDLYQIHDTNRYRVCEAEVIPFLMERQKEGMIGGFGMGTRSHTAHKRAIIDGKMQSNLSFLDYNLLKTTASSIIELSRQYGTAFINASVLYFGVLQSENPLAMDFPQGVLAFAVKMQELCKRLEIDICAAALQFSLLNPDIDMTLNGMKEQQNLEDTMRAMQNPLYPEQWEAIFVLQRSCASIQVEDE